MDMEKGFVVNNTGRSRHIFKRTVYPGQRVSLQDVHDVLGIKVPENSSFLEWLEKYLPGGWEIIFEEREDASGGRPYKEVLTAVPVVEDGPSGEFSSKKLMETNSGPEEVLEEDQRSWQYATPKAIDSMTAKDIFNLRLNDSPERVLKQVTSVNKLRRALTLCNKHPRKATLTRLIQRRIKQLRLTL